MKWIILIQCILMLVQFFIGSTRGLIFIGFMFIHSTILWAGMDIQSSIYDCYDYSRYDKKEDKE